MYDFCDATVATAREDSFVVDIIGWDMMIPRPSGFDPFPNFCSWCDRALSK